MKSLITLTSDQLTRLENNEQVMLCVPLGEQFKDTTMIGGQVIKVELAYWCDCNRHLLQYPIGKVLGVRETWGNPISGWDKNEKGEWIEYPEYIYKSDFDAEDQKKYSCLFVSPRTMPADAIRTHVKVVDNSMKRVQEVTYDGILALGHEIYSGCVTNFSSFRPWFNAKYAKPRPRREKGKIVRYECWAWDMESWFALYKDNKNLEASTYKDLAWKIKPLEIHPDPFCEFPVIKLEVK